MTDVDKRVYIFRVTDAEPGHAPADFDEVAKAVNEDYKTAQGCQQALQAAQKLLDLARTNGLDQAARQTNAAIITTSAFDSTEPAISNYPLPAPASGPFARDAFKLLAEAAKTNNPHPVALVELPLAAKVAVIELNEVQPGWNDRTYAYFQQSVAQQLTRELLTPMRQQWFNFDSIKKRLDYKTRDIYRPRLPAQQPAPVEEDDWF